MRPRPNKRSSMLAATTSLLLLGTGVTGVGAESTSTAQQQQQQQHRRLPQHRVRTPKRQVPYPADHPLSRNLNNEEQQQQLVDEDELAEGEEHGSSSIVGGDGSRSYQRRRRRQQQTEKRSRRNNTNNRFLRFLADRNNAPPSAAPAKRRRRRSGEEEPEAIREGRLVETSAGDTLRYWTISGRNLAVPPAPAGGGGNATADENSVISSSSASLLMDVERIHDENGEQAAEEEEEGSSSISNGINLESSSSSSQQTVQNEGDYNISAEGRQNRRMEDDDDNFDAEEYYNDRESSSTTGEQPITEPQDATTTTTALPPEEDEEEEEEEHSSTNNKSLYQPMRLRAIFTDDPTSGSRYLTPSQRKILMEDIINPALFAWSQALHLIPVGRRGRNSGENGNTGGGGGGGGDDDGDKLVVDRSQLYDGKSCGPGLDSGLPSVRVPREHMTEGLADTDTVVYVSVSFSDGADVSKTAPKEAATGTLPSLYHLHRGATGPKFSAPRRKDALSNDTTTLASAVSMSAEEAASPIQHRPTNHPSSSPSHPPTFDPTETEPYADTPRPTCPGTYLASATYCSSDQHDRPVAGMLSLCIDDAHRFFRDPEQVKRNVVTVMHEIGHILGFNAQSLANFRDADTGRPLTPRDSNGDVPDAKVECTGVRPRARGEVPLPSKDIMKFRTVRGGVRVATIVTPTVQRVASNMFGCWTLEGAELESGEGQPFPLEFSNDKSESDMPSLGDCIGDHWDRRLFRTDLMNAIVDDVPYSLYVSSLTLAYFADAGWYRVDADRIAPASMWGRNAGCGFVDQKCINSNGHVSAGNNPFFCNNFLENDPEEEENNKDDGATEIHGCNLDSSRKAVCSLREYESPMPREYDYFEHDKYLDQSYYYGGSDPTLDYCPVFEGFANGQCDDENSKELMEVKSGLEVFGEVNSRCVIGHVEKKRTALCVPIACVIQEQSLMVKVDGYWKLCSYSGQIISLWWNPNEYIVCPDPSRMCPTFYCPNDCFGEGGICNYPTGQCMCAATAKNSSVANATSTSSWFSSYHSYQHFEPCAGSRQHHLGSSSGTSQVVERIDFELPDYYVENTTVLLNDPRDFDDKVSRMFSQLNAGEVVGLVASFMLFGIFSFIVWSQIVRCYKRRILRTGLSKVRSGVGSLSHMLRSANNLSSLDNDDDPNNHMEMPPTYPRRPRGGANNPQKDKMVATLLYQMRTDEQEEQQRRLELGGLTTVMSSDDEFNSKKANVDSSLNAQTIVDLSSSSDEEVLVNRSDLPPLPPGERVLAVVGARIVEDVATGDDDARSSVTSATQVTSHQSLISSSHHHRNDMSEFSSPLYQDDDNGGRNAGGRMLRLRRHIE